MNYRKIHDNIIQKALSEDRKKSKLNHGYYERHHIIPRCLGGLNKKSNLVLLTAKEHFIVHKLLIKIYPDEKGIKAAHFIMLKSNKWQNRKSDFTAKEYVEAKQALAENMSRLKKGVKFTKEHREKISRANRGETHHNFGKYDSLNSNFGNRGKKNTWFGGKLTEEQKRKIGRSKEGKPRPEYVRQKLSTAHKNRKILICPHCSVEMDCVNSKKYHFDNCKLNPNSKRKIYTCTICGLQTSNKTNIVRFHNENCKYG